ncbi:Protein NRT1/ PTR FAMILY 4.6 like [Actinidia chinensis var. chinensis]|uniref:Protein NRT1/ PTR FAMILY 4.6 like n=1 Tax=Actinidia chinensis var. chinensis TaxID=1590841 RepID=A0A2R6QGX4_ACTCC|nr:Protein NRT1/ PTR FAMILY 4.6 like [Actinidia chinensis var. chinensis]
MPLPCERSKAEAQELNTWEGYVAWKNRPALKGRHGGVLAASFVLVTNFMGTAFLLALLGGFLAEAFFTSYCIYPISATIEFAVRIFMKIKLLIQCLEQHFNQGWVNRGVHMLWDSSLGLLILTLQAHISSLKPPICTSTNRSTPCQHVDGAKEELLFFGLYLVALGVGGIKGSLPPHGAEQFDENTPKGRKQRSTFFNYYVFSLSCGALIAVTFVVWIEDNKGWQWGFGDSTATILISIPIFLLGSTIYRTKIPAGSPMTTILKALDAAIYNTCISRNSSNAVVSMNTSLSSTTDISVAECHAKENAQIQTAIQGLEFLDRAVIRNPIHPLLACTAKQVKEVKIVLNILPIFMPTIMLNCCLAQLSTFSVQHTATMNTKIGSLRVPPASLPVFPVLFMIVLAPVYNHIIIPFFRKVTKTEMGITHLQRIGTGLVLSIVAMAVTALVEIK